MSISGGAVHVGSPPTDFPSEETQLVHFHDFLNLPTTKNEAVYSPHFCCAGHKWQLKVYPGGETEAEHKMMSVFLVSTSSSRLAASFAIKIKKSSGHYLDKSRGEFGDFDIFDQCVSWGWPNYISRDDILWYADSILPHGTLTLEVRIRPHLNYYVYCDSEVVHTRPSDEILKLFLDHHDADVAFQVKEQVFPAHRVILRCFAPDLAELCETFDRTNPMPINDVEPKIFQSMLGVVYGDSIDSVMWKSNSSCLFDPAKHHESILRAAGKYGFSSLRVQAEGWYIKFLGLDIDNAIDHLLHADANNLHHLKKTAMEFIVEHSEEVFKSESYLYLARSPELMSEVMLSLSKKISANKKRKREE